MAYKDWGLLVFHTDKSSYGVASHEKLLFAWKRKDLVLDKFYLDTVEAELKQNSS